MFVSPMLLQKSDQPFDDHNYITELKLDGIRLIYSYIESKRLYSRHNNEVTHHFPELLAIEIPKGTILDGEFIVTDENGKPDFEEANIRFRSSKQKVSLQYCVFDIIYHNGSKVNLPLIERKQLLETVIPPNQNTIVTSKWIKGNAIAYFELCKEYDLEGLIMKRSSSTYQIDKRSHDWLKVINYKYLNDVYITGLRKDEFGILLGVEQDGKIQSAGIMEFMPPAARKELYQRYKSLINGENDKFVFLDPSLQLNIKFRNWTRSGKLRIPSFIGWVD